ncbi:MAG: hypothetical protein WD054_05475 [Gemmatimonadota bacterium]
MAALAYSSGKDPADIVKVGQKVSVTVMSADLDRNRIALSMKPDANTPAPPRRQESRPPPRPAQPPAPRKGDVAANGMRFR